MRAWTRSAGFTLVEILVATAITLVVMACVFLMAAPAQDAFAVQPEAADVQQRVRVTVVTLTKDLMMAGAGRTFEHGCEGAEGAAVLPYRVGDVASDAPAGRYYRPDAISIAYVDERPGSDLREVVRRTYHLRAASPDMSQLMRYDGRVTDHPVLEDVVALAFEYFGAPASGLAGAGDPVVLDPALLVDGPWCPDAAHPGRFDADLLRIRRIRVRLRVQAPRAFRGPQGTLFMRPGDARTSRYVPDQELRFDVAPRNLSHDR